MSDENVFMLKSVHEEFAKRIEDENHRQNKRIEVIEDHVCEITRIAANVEKLAINMEHMVGELKDQGIRLKALEDRDGEMWRKLVSHIATSIISIILGYIACKLGLG